MRLQAALSVLLLSAMSALLAPNRAEGQQNVERLLRRAEASLDRGRLARSRRLLEAAALVEPQDEATAARVMDLAARLAVQGTEDDAVRFLALVDVRGSEPRALWLAKANAQVRLGRLSEALTTLSAAGAQDTDAAALLRSLSAASAEAGDLQLANRALRIARRVMPQDVEITIDLAAIHSALGQPERAIPLLLDVLRVSRAHLGAMRMLGGTLMGAGREAEAMTVLDDVASRTRAASDHLRSAWAAYEAADHVVALELAESARTAGADPVEVDRIVGFSAAALGEDERARAALERVLTANPGDARARAALTQIQ